MKIENYASDRVLGKLLKEPFEIHTATSIAKALNITRQGTWKILNRLAQNKLVSLEFVGKAKTSTATIKLNWSNPATEKTLSLILTNESLKQQRWRVNFAEIENDVNFLILFGSILNNPKEANDIDLLAIVKKKKFKMVEELIIKAQQSLLKKVHLVDLTEREFGQELRKPNKAYLDVIKKGVVLCGPDDFIRFMKGLQK